MVNGWLLFLVLYNIVHVTVITGARCLGKLLKVNSLQELDIKLNAIGDEGISLVVNGLKCSNTCTLKKLNVSTCKLSVEGTVF